MKKVLLLLIFFCAILSSNAQEQSWVTMMKDPEVNFYDLQKSFYQYWEGKTIEKGKGYKQFKRYEAFMKPRVYPSGTIPMDIVNEEMSKVISAKSRTSAAGNWSHMGPNTVPTNGLSYPHQGIGRINCVRFDPQNNNIIWTGSPGGGLWKSTNGGTSWTSNTDAFATLGISDIAIHPTNSNTMYIATGDFDASDTYSIGVLKSTDGGATWQTTGFSQQTSSFYRISRLLINPSNPEILIAATNSGIMRTINGGTTWSTIISGIFADAEFKPGDPNVVYASSYGNASVGKMYYSTNAGQTFTQATGIPTSDVLRISVAVTPANPEIVYALIANSTNSGYKGLYKSTNSGVSYTLVNSTPNILSSSETGSGTGGQGWYDLALAVSPLDANLIYVGGVNVWKSTNGGTTFSITGHWYGGNSGNIPFVHADQHILEFQPNSSVIFSGNDGGLRKSTNNGALWNDLSNGLQITQFYRIAAAATNANIVLAGAQDNGTNKYSSTAWSTVYGGDGMNCEIDYTNANIVYASTQYGGMQRSTNGGTSFSTIKPAAAPDGDWITPYVLDPIVPTTIYAGFDEIYKSTNSGSTWTTITAGLSGANSYEFIRVAPSNTSVIYAGYYNKIYKTVNGGTSWTNITSTLPVTSAYIEDITVSNTDPNKIWACFSGYSAGNKVFYSSNGGTSWTNISSGLPNLPVNVVVYQNGSNDAIYIGTDVGVYYKSNTVAWTSFMTNLPNVKVQDLDIHYGTGKIRAATYGRGLWESELYSSVVAPVANFSANQTTINAGSSINFTDLSTNTPTTWAWTFTGGTPSSSTSQNPSNISYSTAGTYAVSLMASNAGGSNTNTKTSYITVNAVNLSPVANFTANQTTIFEGQSITFTDQSTNTPNAWTWTFTGGTPSSSTTQNPTITYTTAGTYAVKLKVTNANGGDSLTKLSYIIVNAAGNASCKSWNTQATGFSTANRGIGSIDIVDQNVVWALAYDGSGAGATIRDYTKTINGGTTWTPGSINVATSYGIANIHPLNKDTAWASVYPTTATNTAQGVYVTYNGGTTWTKQATATYSDAASFINLVHFFNKNDGVAQGDPTLGSFEIYTTSNGGATWARVNSANIPTPIAADEYGTVGYYTALGNTIWFLTNKGRIFRSLNKGLNWTVATTPLGNNVTFTDIEFKDANNGLLVGVNSSSTDIGIYKTSDGGDSWTLLTTSTAGITAKSDICFVPGSNSTYYISGATTGGSGSAYSTDDGQTWTSIDVIQHTAIEFYNSSVGWSGGFNTNSTTGGIFKLANSNLSASINTPSVTTFCDNESIVLSANAGVGYSYQWYRNGSLLSGANAINHTATQAGLYTVEVTEGTCTALSPSVELFTNPIPSVPTITGLSSVCTGDTTTLQASSASSYQWYKNDVLIPNAIQSTLEVSETGNYKVKIGNAQGCFNTSNNFAFAVISQVPKPAVNASGSTNVCSGGTLFLSSSITSNIQWYKDGVAISGATQSVINVTGSGNYHVVASAGSGLCFTSSDTLTVIFLPVLASPSITQDSLTLTSSVADSYQWFKNAVAINGATAQSYTVTANGDYHVRIKDVFLCEAFSDTITVLISGLNEDRVVDFAKVFPNPSNGNFTLEYQLNESSMVDIRLFNILGQEIKIIKQNGLQNVGIHRVVVNHHNIGIYILRLKTSTGTKEIKLIIQ